jgi:hypothetical protein
MKTTTAELVEMLRQKSRELRQSARRCDAAVAALLEPQKAQGRPTVNPKRELYEAVKQSGLTYAQIAAEVGVSYRYVSWVGRAKINSPELETRIREVLAVHAGGSSVISAQ